MLQRSPRNEQGATLVIVLIFIMVFGLILAGLLTQAGASTRYTGTVSRHEEKVYAADAGVSLGIQQLQQKNQICPSTAPEQAIQVVTVNGVATQVTCEVTSGSTQGAGGYSIITRSPESDRTQGSSLKIQSGQAKTVTGPVFVTGDVDGFPNPGLIVRAGTFGQKQGNGCTAPLPPAAAPTPNGLTLDPGYSYSCGTDVPPNPPHVAPPRPGTAASPGGVGLARPATISGNCKIFYPGLYTSANTPSVGPLTNDTPLGFSSTQTNYFASGVYYFNVNSRLTIDQPIYGGKPASFERVQYPLDGPVPCADPDPAPAEVSGSGVQFILGGGASMFAANNSQVELFTRTEDGTANKVHPTFVAVPSDWASADSGWVENTHNTQVLDFANGSNPDLVIHGLIYAPEENVRLWSTLGVDAAVLGGVVAWKLELQSSNGGPGGLAISAHGGKPDPRHIAVRATAPYPASGEKQVVSTAVLEIANDASLSNGFTPTVTLKSWRTRGLNDVL